MKTKRKDQIYRLLKAIETGDPESVKVVNENKYIQHNPQTHEGGEGLAALFKRLSKTNPKVEVVRLFEDADFVFGHTIYDFSSVRIGFEIFRFEGDQVVEHWDNIQPRVGDMVSGTTDVRDQDRTDQNRGLIKKFISQVFLEKKLSYFEEFISVNYTEHSSLMDLSKKIHSMDYKTNHRLLADGDFVLTVNEGVNQGEHSSFYDLFRLENVKIIEHWDTTEKVPPKSEWRNQNGKF